ncbi:undecaprenyldiphospho-muramoylpentapeptide beta-N-acetylglucosaminyltransferase [Synechococcus sp. H55.7]|uniref:undecaprenyldiphospho-muramoylpentapeptide beta-N-acetylglucosaminyltransferase n=1 Tax=unclassified Synechococcus TaxID=2626047 RepID=UPI0039C027B0
MDTRARATVSLPRLLVAASGTGGHVFPALAIAEQLPDWQIEWLGVPDRMEGKLVQERYPLHRVAMSGWQGSPLHKLRALAQLARATLQVRQLLKSGRFDIVLTTGGYISAPTILAARSLRVPVLLHESNRIPGKVTRWLGRFCHVVALGMAEAAEHLPGVAAQVVGTPVRAEFYRPQPLPADLPIPDGDPLIVVIGGSQGARGLNRMVAACAEAWLEAGAWIVHLTGGSEAGIPIHPRYRPFPFRTDVAALLQRATFAISRAGAMSLAELWATATPAILIPYPFAAEDHQYQNALAFVGRGGGVVMRESEEHVDLLRQTVLTWLAQPQVVAQMAAHLQATAPPNASKAVAHLLQEICQSSAR